jgi:hypothetical protein
MQSMFAQIESRFIFNHSRIGIHDPSARVAAITTADTGIDAARQFVRSLITRRNTLVPIFLLPTEILTRVFHLLVREELPLSRWRNMGWIRVTHVCQHWRQVALDDSSLWAKIWGIPKNTKWISEMLTRAKNAPLDIEFRCSKNLEALHMIPPQLSRTRRLRFHNLSTDHSYGDHDVRKICSFEAPALEHFELTATDKLDISFRDLGRNMLFKGHAPRLQTISLSQVVIPWSLIPRGQLTQLKIARPLEDIDYPGELEQLIDLLVNCPALELLSLDSCLPSQLTKLSHGQTIHLSHLSRLRLCGSTSRILNTLKMLKLPSSTTLHLNCISNMTTIHDDVEGLLLPVVSAQFQSLAPIEFKSLTVAILSLHTTSLNITASTSTSPSRETQNFEGDVVGNPELVLSFKGLRKPGHSTDLLEQACKSLPISNLEFISMSAYVHNTVDANWVELFSCCTNVITVRAIGHGTSNFVQAVIASTATNTKSGKGRRKRRHDNRENTLVQPASTVAHAHAAVFPKLMSLGLTDMNIADGNLGILFDDLERSLQQRMAASGAPLKSLCLSDCYISTEHANDLKKLVQNFEHVLPYSELVC